MELNRGHNDEARSYRQSVDRSVITWILSSKRGSYRQMLCDVKVNRSVTPRYDLIQTHGSIHVIVR